MKAIKYLFTAALLAGFSTAALAQDGSKADVDAVKKIISSKPADLDKQMKPFYKAKRNRLPTPVILVFPGGSAGKESTAIWEIWVRSLGWEDLLEKGMTTYSSILA